MSSPHVNLTGIKVKHVQPDRGRVSILSVVVLQLVDR